MSTIIIVGASAAGIAACGKLRDFNSSARIICITKEREMPYNRCLIADFLGGSRTEALVHTKGEQFFIDNDIELKLDCEVVALDVDTKTVTLQTGEKLEYDALLIATGRSATPLVIPNSAIPVFPFYDLAHAKNILDFIENRKNPHALIIGGGISGLECADALLQRGVKITLIERGPHLLPRQMDEGGARFLQTLMESKGITIHNNTTIETLQKSVTPDLIIAATGGRQNTQFAQAAGVTCNEFGIVTDEHQATNFDEIFAAGDVCSVNDLVTEKPTCSTLWPDAVAQGLVAAHSIALYLLKFGQNTRLPIKTYAGTLNITSTNIFGTTLVTCGDFSTDNACHPCESEGPSSDVIPALRQAQDKLPAGTQSSQYTSSSAPLEILTKQDDTFYHKLYLRDEVLQGFVMVGNVTGIGQLRKAMVDKTRIT